MEFKGTKGKWDVPYKTYHTRTDENDKPIEYTIYIRSDEDRWNDPESPDDTYTVAAAYGLNIKEAEANAKLIAAAPDLLDVLIFMRDNNDWSNDPVGKFKVEQAIKKALGES